MYQLTEYKHTHTHIASPTPSASACVAPGAGAAGGSCAGAGGLPRAAECHRTAAGGQPGQPAALREEAGREGRGPPAAAVKGVLCICVDAIPQSEVVVSSCV